MSRHLQEILNKCLLREEIKELIVGDCLIFSGILFHSIGPAALKDRSP